MNTPSPQPADSAVLPTTSTVVVVPCYNESGRLKVELFRQFLARQPGISFVLVNDGSRDQTLQILKQVQEGFAEQVRILDRAVNRGKGESVREGLLLALDAFPNVQVVGFWDADLATPLEAILDLVQILECRLSIQMVFGSRVNLLGRKIVRNPIRHYLGRVFASTVSVMLNLPVYDTQCGAKLFRATPELKRILEEGPFSSRWVFDVELIARWIRLNRYSMDAVKGSIYEFPLYAWEDVGGSKVKPGDFFKAFMDVLKIYRRYMRGGRQKSMESN